MRTTATTRGDALARNRSLVHLGLMLVFLAAVISAVFLSRKYLGHSGTTDHSIIGLLVLVFVLVHLTQRRHTVGRLISQFFRRSASTKRRSGQVVSDTTLWILTLNAVVSGVMDFLAGHTIFLSVPGPHILQKWHATSVLVLLIYVIVHVTRRRKRLRTSRIR